MDLKRLEYFCTIIEKGQISKAAQALNMSQPPLSMRLKELEEELGVQLIYREGKAWQVTPEGEALYHRAQFVLSYVSGMVNDVTARKNEVAGLVRIGVCPPCMAMAGRCIPTLFKRYPQLRFRVWVMDNQSLERHMQERNIDIALLQLPVQNTNYMVYRLPRMGFVAVFGHGLSAPDSNVVSVEALENLPLLLSRRRDGGGGYDMLMRAFQKQGVRANVILDSQDTRLLHSLLLQGMPAVAVLPEPDMNAVDLSLFAVRPLSVTGLDLSPVIIHLEGAYQPHAVQVVLQEFVTMTGELVPFVGTDGSEF